MKAKNEKNKNILKPLIRVSVIIMIGMSLILVAVIVLLTLLSFNTKVDTYWALIVIPVATAFAVPFVYVINKRAVKHIDTLSEGINNVANGNLNVEIDVSGDHIFEDVYKNFNKMVRELKSVGELRNDILDCFSHELKTPISSINGCAKLLYEGGLSDEKVKKYLSIILRDSDRMAKFVQDMLLLIKLDAQEIVTDKVEYDLSEQIRECLINLSSMWEQKGIEISVDLPECLYYGNRILMENVWNNLLTNAIKYTPTGGRIDVGMKVCGGEVSVSIADTGIGMSEEVLRHIYERFYRASSESGHGLGLSIVDKTLKLVGGKIEAKSNEGEGSTFTVTIPLSSFA